MTLHDLRRLYHICCILIHYGLATPPAWLKLPFFLRNWRYILFWKQSRYVDQPLGIRLQQALQTLGPIWVKFGQMLSTRCDLLPIEVTTQLALLQDRVAPFDGQTARAQVEQMLGGPLAQWFVDFDLKPLASASIAQVHTARLKESGCSVILKIIRPGIRSCVIADIRLMYWLAGYIERWFPQSRQLRPVAIVNEYETTLLDELNLLHEAANMIQMRRHFENSPLLYVPHVYVDYCREGLLTAERISAIPISDIAQLKAHGIQLQLLAERGVKLFFTQVFRDSLFHADMHPGNIFVSYDHPHDPQYIAVDYGIVGTLSRENKRYLAGNFIAFFNRDYRKVAQLHVDSGWVPSQTNVEQFEFAIRTVCEPIFQKPLAQISFGHVLVNLLRTARRFEMTIQPQLILLQKTLLYVEGLGKSLYPQLDLWKTAKPFLEEWMATQISWKQLWKIIKEKTPQWLEQMPELPELWYTSLHHQKHLQEKLTQLIDHHQNTQQKSPTLRPYKLLLIFIWLNVIMSLGESCSQGTLLLTACIVGYLLNSGRT